MARFIVLALVVAALAACSDAGPRGYGYAANDRPSLTQLGFAGGEGNALGGVTSVQDKAVQ